MVLLINEILVCSKIDSTQRLSQLLRRPPRQEPTLPFILQRTERVGPMLLFSALRSRKLSDARAQRQAFQAYDPSTHQMGRMYV